MQHETANLPPVISHLDSNLASSYDGSCCMYRDLQQYPSDNWRIEGKVLFIEGRIRHRIHSEDVEFIYLGMNKKIQPGDLALLSLPNGQGHRFKLLYSWR